jgi:hypothetical protein
MDNKIVTPIKTIKLEEIIRAWKTTLRLEKGGGLKAKNKTTSRMREENVMF